MKKQNEKPKTASEEYPELDKIAEDICKISAKLINVMILKTKTKCPYPAQCIIELLISKLEECV